MQVCRPAIPQWWEGPDTLAELAARAVLECLDALTRAIEPEEVPVFVLLSPPDRPHRDPELDRVVLEGLQDRLGFPLAPTSRVYNAGRTGLLPAFLAASQLFTAGAGKSAIIVGVDSFLRQPVVDVFMEYRRVLTGDNSNGFIQEKQLVRCCSHRPSHGKVPDCTSLAGALDSKQG
jgi:3-oxoacyl-[acyl-carrier-protein] synthase-1